MALQRQDTPHLSTAAGLSTATTKLSLKTFQTLRLKAWELQPLPFTHALPYCEKGIRQSEGMSGDWAISLKRRVTKNYCSHSKQYAYKLHPMACHKVVFLPGMEVFLKDI